MYMVKPKTESNSVIFNVTVHLINIIFAQLT